MAIERAPLSKEEILKGLTSIRDDFWYGGERDCLSNEQLYALQQAMAYFRPAE